MSQKKPLITYFTRKPFDGQFSIERVFDQLIPKITAQYACKWHECLQPSKGLIKRLRNVWDARNNQSDINHITGDVHYLALGLKKSKTILTIHDLAFLQHPNLFARLMLWLFWVYIPVRRVKLVTTVSKASQKDILRFGKISPDKIRVIPNYVDPLFQWKPKVFNSVCPVLLLVGTNANKNLERVIEAMEALPLKARIIGKLNPHQQALLRKYQINYSTACNLSTKEMVVEYQLCDFIAFCSTSEGFGLPILEAQATGRPVITSTISATLEVAGASACLIDPFDTQSIRSAILKVIEDEQYRNNLIQAGTDNIKRFTLEEVVRQYLDVYREIHPKQPALSKF